MLSKILTGSLLLVISNTNVNPATVPESICTKTTVFFQTLRERYEESPIMLGTFKDKVITVWINKKTRTASIVMTDTATDTSCLMADMIDTKVIDNSIGI